jgi:hypothetical protein
MSFILGAKTLNQYAPFILLERAELYMGAERQLKEAMPDEIPMAVPQGAFMRMVNTMREMEKLLRKTQTLVSSGLDIAASDAAAGILSLPAEVDALLGVVPETNLMPPKASQVAAASEAAAPAPTSRIILPS